MDYYARSALNLILFLLPVLIGIRNYNSHDKALKIFVIFALSSFVGELSAFYCAIKFKNNLAVYNGFSIVNLLIICFYFKEHFSSQKSKKIFNILILLSVLVWIVTAFVIHSLKSINSTFLGYQGLLTITLSACLMEEIVARKSKEVFSLKSSIHFWIALLLLVYWCFSIMQWLLYRYIINETIAFKYLELSLIIINMFINLCFALIFYVNPKLGKNDL